jgi:hypothetical protein
MKIEAIRSTADAGRKRRDMQKDLLSRFMYGTSGGEFPSLPASCVTVQPQGKKRFLISVVVAATEKQPM